ncbi:MAG: diguanylate cyclase [Pseudomonadota bacterium]
MSPLRPSGAHAWASPWLRLLWCGLLWLGFHGASAAQPVAEPASASAQRLRLDTDVADIDAWPVLQMLADPEARLSIQGVVMQGPQFVRPTTPYANLGVRREVVWLKIPLDVPRGQASRWILRLDYPPLDQVGVYLLTDGMLMDFQVVGDHKPASERPLPVRPHAVSLNLREGHHEVLLRVQTDSSMLVPVHFMRPDTFYADENSFQLGQGLMTGVGLCLALYSLLQWLSLRDRMFFYYALCTLGSTGFFFSWYGLAAQYLWPNNAYLVDNGPPLAALVTVMGSMLFIARAMGVARWSLALANFMRFLALTCLATMAGSVVGLLDYRTLVMIANGGVALMLVLIVPVAWVQARRGDKASLYLFIGWSVYSVGIGMSTAMLRGLVDMSPWSHYAYQTAAMFEMLMWLRVLSVRLKEIRVMAERAGREREMLQSLAHTDALTGLPNRRCLLIELEAALARLGQSQSLAVYLLDLDGFKSVNDQHGHDAGDDLLIAVGQRLQGAVRGNDTLARFGGDEFVLLAPEVTSESAQQLGEKILAQFEQPFEVRGRQHAIGLTVGYALAPRDGHTSTSLLRCADQAMYNGKQAGKQCVRSQVIGDVVPI